jgi:hypothetical protein
MLTSAQVEPVALLTEDGDAFHLRCAGGEQGSVLVEYDVSGDERWQIEGLQCEGCQDWIEEPDEHYAYCDDCSEYTPVDDYYGDTVDPHHAEDDLDRESSASRQHYIDTGRYLRHGEAE